MMKLPPIVPIELPAIDPKVIELLDFQVNVMAEIFAAFAIKYPNTPAMVRFDPELLSWALAPVELWRETCPPSEALSDPSAPTGPTENIE